MLSIGCFLELYVFLISQLPIEDTVLSQFCCGAGGLKVHAKINKSGYVQGEMIEVDININNASSIKINRIDLALKKVYIHMYICDRAYINACDLRAI